MPLIGRIDTPLTNRHVKVPSAIPAGSQYYITPGPAPTGVKQVPDNEPLRETFKQVHYAAAVGDQVEYKLGVVEDIFWIDTTNVLLHGDITITTPWGDVVDAVALIRDINNDISIPMFGAISPGKYTFKANRIKTWRFVIKHLQSDV